MKNIGIGIVVIALVAGGYLFIKNQQIKKELANVEESQFVEGGDQEQNAATVASDITLNRVDGVWNVQSTGDYTIDASTLKFEFTGYKPGGQHTGTFQNMTAAVALDAAGKVIGGGMKLDPKSIKTDTAAVDKHLQADVFFDTANHPDVTVAIKKIEENSDVMVHAITDITIKGTTKTLSIPVRVEKTATGMKFWVDTKIKISEYGMAYGPVQDDVRVVASGELKKK